MKRSDEIAFDKNAAAVAHEHYKLKFDDVWQRYTTERGKAFEKPTEVLVWASLVMQLLLKSEHVFMTGFTKLSKRYKRERGLMW